MIKQKVTFMDDTISYIGKSVKVHLKTGEKFYLKVTRTKPDFIFGHDEEGRNRRVYKHELDYIVEG